LKQSYKHFDKSATYPFVKVFYERLKAHENALRNAQQDAIAFTIIILASLVHDLPQCLDNGN
jgi:hypothetical protein